MINEASVKAYIKRLFGKKALSVRIEKLGQGVQGAGFLIEIDTPDGIEHYVIKGLFPEGLEHDYPADRGGVFLLDLEEFGNLPKHVRAVDVLAEMEKGDIKSIGGGREYYLLMEKAEGQDYFTDLVAFGEKSGLDEKDKGRISELALYLTNIHSVKKKSKQLYWRKVRDTIGHGECLMGVFDTYPEGVLSLSASTEIEKKCIDWRARLKPKYNRLCQVHGDFHPGNIWFQNDRDFILLDRSRGAWGDSADDVTALTMNYIFFSINRFGKLAGPYREAIELFYDQYVNKSGDHEVLEVAAPFYAFRGAVVANPVFYPDVTEDKRQKIINFINGVLDTDKFEVDRINEYMEDR